MESLKSKLPNSQPDAYTEAETIGDAVYGALAQALVQGELKPGERVKIRELAATMGTSVTPVRDAVRQLVQDGALEMRSPRDIRVSSISREEYIEIREIRIELEGMAAAAAASKATAEDLAVLSDLIARNEQALRERRFADAVRLNYAFHFEYCRLAEMPNLLAILKRLWLKMGPLIAESYAAGGRHMVDHHYPLIDALRRKDGRAARIAVQTDIVSGGEAILRATRPKEKLIYQRQGHPARGVAR